MSDVILFRGGPCIPLCMPFCGPAPADIASKLSFPTRVAGEYDRGRFTLGALYDVMNNGNFRDAVKAANVEADDFIALLMVPPKHTVSDLFVEVNPEGQVYAPNPRLLKKNAAGATFKIEARLFNSEGEQQSVVTLPAAFNSLAADVKTAVRQALNSGSGYFVPADAWLMIGLVVVDMPTDENVKWSDLSSFIAVVAKVDDYQYPMII